MRQGTSLPRSTFRYPGWSHHNTTRHPREWLDRGPHRVPPRGSLSKPARRTGRAAILFPMTCRPPKACHLPTMQARDCASRACGIDAPPPRDRHSPHAPSAREATPHRVFHRAIPARGNRSRGRSPDPRPRPLSPIPANHISQWSLPSRYSVWQFAAQRSMTPTTRRPPPCSALTTIPRRPSS